MSTAGSGHHRTLRRGMAEQVLQEQLDGKEHTALHSAPLLSGQHNLTWAV